MSDSPDHPDAFSDDNEFRGPANWFRLQFPNSVELRQKESVVELRPAAPSQQPGWSMAIYAAWVESETPQETASGFSVSNLFPTVVRSREIPPLETGTSNRRWAGISRRRGSGRWWQRLVPQRYEWRLWILEHRQVMFVASLQSAPGHLLDDADIGICEQILASVTFADEPAMPPEPFRQEVIALAKQHFPLLEVSAQGRFSVNVQGSEINLSNFYRSYLQQPDSLTQMILPGLTSVVRLQEWGPDQVMPPLEDVQSRIMPMLYPEEDAVQTLRHFVQLPWIGGLKQVFVIDEDDTYRFVHDSMLQEWQLTVESLQQLAMENLDTYAADHPLQVNLVGDEDDPQMLVPVNADPYNSSRILGRTFHKRLRELFGPEVLVGVPNRDFFVAVSFNHPRLISHVQDKVLQDYQSMHHPLTQRLLVISADGVSEYCHSESE